MHEWKNFFLHLELRSKSYWDSYANSYANPSDSKVCEGFSGMGISVREQPISKNASWHRNVLAGQNLKEIGKDKYFRLETDEG